MYERKADRLRIRAVQINNLKAMIGVRSSGRIRNEGLHVENELHFF